MVRSQTAQGLDAMFVNDGHQIQGIQVCAVPFHVWQQDEPCLWVSVFKNYAICLLLLLQNVMHPLKHSSV